MPRTTNRKAKAHLRSGRWITEKKRFAIYLRDRLCCVYCGVGIESVIGTGGVTLDHVKEGGNQPKNLVTCCKKCNDSKSGEILEVWAESKAVLARVRVQLALAIDVEAGQRLYERIKGIGQPEAMPSLPGLSVAQAAGLVQMSEAEIETRIEAGEIKKEKYGIDIVALVHRALTAAKRVAHIAGEKSESASRKAKSEADSAEMDTLEKLHKLCPMSDAKLFWSDARIEVKQTIERAPYLTPIQKTKLLLELAALKPKLETDK